MRIATLLAVLFFLATSSTALAATRAIKFGRLVDGLGRVFTNAVVIVEDDRVRSVASGSPGFFADIVAVEGDPLADITAISKRENVRWVMKAGRVVVDKTRGTERAH